jgi:hypothetical protein
MNEVVEQTSRVEPRMLNTGIRPGKEGTDAFLLLRSRKRIRPSARADPDKEPNSGKEKGYHEDYLQ